MTVDIVRAETNAIATLDGANEALARIGQWVEAAHHAHQLVAPLVDTPFVPDSYRPKVDPRATAEQKKEAYEVAVATATAAVLQGISLGLDPLTALQQIYVVHGRPGMYAKMMVALVQAHGHEVWTEEGECTDTRAVVYGRRRGTERVERVIVTMDMARKAGWTKNEAYGKTPQDMLWARAAGRVCDRIASDALKGLASVEAIRDELETPTGGGTRTVAPRRRVQATVGNRPAPEPPLGEESAVDYVAASTPGRINGVPPQDDEPMISPAQQKKLHALLRDAGLGSRADGLAFIAQVLDRTVTSTKELTKVDAGRVIDRLETPEEEPPLDEPATAEPEPDWPETAPIPDAEP